ncbi:hypothetical protein Tco_1546082 [Tanacetum coccineum]
MSSSFSFVQTNCVLDDEGTKFNDSRNKLSLQTFSMMNEIDGLDGDGRLVLMYSGSSSSSSSTSSLTSSFDSSLSHQLHLLPSFYDPSFLRFLFFTYDGDCIDEINAFGEEEFLFFFLLEMIEIDILERITPLVQSCQRDPEAPALSLINQDLLYLKKGNSGPEKIVLSLHKFPAIVFNDDDIEERTSRWVNKCIKKFNPYARYGVENWKNPHAKIFYIRRQKEPGRPKEEIYSNSKIVQVIKTYWELGHEHKFITEIVARRANDCIVSITEPDYKNLNKNDIEDMYLLIVNNKVPDYANTGLLWSLSVFIRSSVIWERVHNFQLGIESYQQKINLTAPTITFPGIEEYDVFSIVYEPVHGIIYTNSKKEKRVMRHSEIHKFCDATLRRTLEGLKSYYNDIKYG